MKRLNVLAGPAAQSNPPKTEPQIKNRRRHERRAVFAPARLETSAGSLHCQLINISASGARVRVGRPVPQDDPVTLVMGRFGTFRGMIVWQRNGSLGIRFLLGEAAPDAGTEQDPTSTADRLDGGASVLSGATFATSSVDNERTNAVVSQLRSEVLGRINPEEVTRLSRESLVRVLGVLVAEIASEQNISVNQIERVAVVERITDEMLGFGPLEPLLADDTVSDILVNGPKRVYVERRGKLELSDVVFNDNEHVLNIATRIVTQVGRRVDESVPVVDARLADGSRVNVIIPPLALDGPMISIRKFAKRDMTLDAMASTGSMTSAMATVLKIAARCRINILVSGGTGAGKTTLLNALSQMIDPGERIITIEDAAELQLQQPHVGRLETRPANLEGKGEITIRDLFKNALRMRPDRIIVGEIRAAEAFDMLQAMNSGHDGSLGTIHASGPREALTRLENIISMTGMSMTSRAMRVQIASAIDLVVQISRMRDGKRRVTSISEIVGMEGDVITMQELFSYEFESESPEGELLGRFVSTGLRPHFVPQADYYGLGRELVQAAGGRS